MFVNADFGRFGSKQRLSLDAGACESPFRDLQHLGITGFWVIVAAALPDD